MTAPPPPSPRSTRATIAELRSVAITGLFVLAVFYTLHLARDLFLPVVLALFLALLLRPLVRALGRVRVPPPAAAALLLVLLLGGSVAALYQMWTPAAEWVARAPEDLKRLDRRLRRLLRPVESVSRTAAQVEEITAVGGDDTPQVALREPGLMRSLFGGARFFLASCLIVLVLAYFFLASGDQFLRKVTRILPGTRAERVRAIVTETEGQISGYLLAVTLINMALGLLTAGAMALLGMPTPGLLGVAAAILNFVPYLGPIAMATLLAMIGLISFAQTGQALLPPLIYLLFHGLEANFVTPHLLGRRLPLNPTVIFLGFLFWFWIWGIPGALLAVPILVLTKTVCDRTEKLAGLGELLGR